VENADRRPPVAIGPVTPDQQAWLNPLVRTYAILVALIERTGGFDYARQRAAQLASEARALIADERAGAARRALDAAIDYAIQRDH